MLKRVLFIIAIVGFCPKAVAEDASPMIRETLDAQVAAWNRGDLEGFMEGYLRSEDLVFTSGGNVRRGWETTFRKYRERYGSARETMGDLAFSDLEIHPMGSEAAWVLGHWQLTYPDKTTEGGVFTLVMQNVEGKWRVVHDHTSVSAE